MRIQFTETVLRDANQSLIATRMPFEAFAPILKTLDQAGYYSLECWGGATFDSCLRYLDEEILLVCNELDSGISEAEAYMHFGRRCHSRQYMKLASLLVQNLRRGNDTLLQVLQEEAQNSFEERKNLARELGEEAGTRLLFPMMIMLGITLLIIMVPAYFSFSM